MPQVRHGRQRLPQCVDQRFDKFPQRLKGVWTGFVRQGRHAADDRGTDDEAIRNRRQGSDMSRSADAKADADRERRALA